MLLVLLQAKADPDAEPVASACADFELLRIAVGQTPTTLQLGDVSAAIVWSPAAERLGWKSFSALLPAGRTPPLIRIGATPIPTEASGFPVIPWDAMGSARLAALFQSAEDSFGDQSKGILSATARGAAAGIAAAVGIFAAGAAPVTAAPPAEVTRRLGDRRRVEAASPTVAAPAPQVAQEKPAPAALDLDLLAKEDQPASTPAQVLASALLQHTKLPLAKKPAPPQPTTALGVLGFDAMSRNR